MQRRLWAVIALAGLLPMTGPLQADEPAPVLTPAQLLDEAASLREASQYNEALAVLRQVVDQRESDAASAAQAQVRLGDYYLHMALPVEGEAELRKVARDFPEQSEAVGLARVSLVTALMYQGRNDDALTAARALFNDTNVDARFQAWGCVQTANLLRLRGELTQARNVLETLDSLSWAGDDQKPRVLGKLYHGEILLDTGAPSEAVAVLQEGLTIAGTGYDNTRNWLRVRLTSALVDSWRHDEVQAVCDAVIADHATGAASDQQLAWALIWQGRSAIRRRDYADAVTPLQMAAATAQAHHPDLAFEAQFDLAGAYGRAGDHTQALAYFGAAYAQAAEAGLGEDRLDRARLQVGSEARHMGMREKGIAWLRQGLQDPANLIGLDRVLVERMTSFMTLEEATAWHDYLASPTTVPDPTRDMVLQAFGVEPPVASLTTVNRAFQRAFWWAELKHKQKAYTDALAGYEQAEAQASDGCEEGRALLGQAKAQIQIANQTYREQGPAEGRPIVEAARATMRDAVDAFLGFAVSSESGPAHFAIEQAVRAPKFVYLPDESLTVANRAVELMAPLGDPSKLAFAEHMQMQALASAGQLTPAIELALSLDQTYAGYDDPAIIEIRAASLIRASAYYARSGNVAAGRQLLDTVEARYPDRYDQWTVYYREACDRAAAAAE